MSEHSLKTIDRYYDAVERGEKTFEVRKNDRAFQKGDTLLLRRYDVDQWGVLRQTVPSRTMRKKVTYVLQGGQFGIEPTYCVMGLADP